MKSDRNLEKKKKKKKKKKKLGKTNEINILIERYETMELKLINNERPRNYIVELYGNDRMEKKTFEFCHNYH